MRMNNKRLCQKQKQISSYILNFNSFQMSLLSSKNIEVKMGQILRLKLYDTIMYNKESMTNTISIHFHINKLISTNISCC